jgi:hypothetical protein
MAGERVSQVVIENPIIRHPVFASSEEKSAISGACKAIYIDFEF